MPATRNKKPLPYLPIDANLTPQSAPSRGYKWEGDVLYDHSAPFEAMKDILVLIEEDGYKLGRSSSSNPDLGTC